MVGLLAASFFLYGAYSSDNALAQALSEGVGVSIEITGPPPGGGGGGGGTPPPQPGDVTFQGKAFPTAFMTLSTDGAVSATFIASVDGTFSHTLTGVNSGIHKFSISAEDTDGRDSVTLSLNYNVAAGTQTTISGLFFPPTISSEPNIEKGQALTLQGQGFPGANIFLFIEPGSIVKETKVQPNGKWQYALATKGLAVADYTITPKAVTDAGEQSELGQAIQFTVDPVPKPECNSRADYNCDGSVNYKDASILLHYWFRGSEFADLNGDGFVDHTDFSILMYYWTG